MKNCDICGKGFPFNVKIDGKNRNLKNRKYCLDCSPFGKHNTKKLHIDEKSRMFQICSECGKECKAGRKAYKGICQTCRVNKKRRELKMVAIEYKGGKCIICGYSKCVRALNFHHINPSEKDFGISDTGYKRTWEITKQELDKCVLVCANCHAEIHDNLIDLTQYFAGR